MMAPWVRIDRDVSPDAGWMVGRGPVPRWNPTRPPRPGQPHHQDPQPRSIAGEAGPLSRTTRWPSMSGTTRATLSASPVRNLSSTAIVHRLLLQHLVQPSTSAVRCCFTVEVAVPSHGRSPRPGGAQVDQVTAAICLGVSSVPDRVDQVDVRPPGRYGPIHELSDRAHLLYRCARRISARTATWCTHAGGYSTTQLTAVHRIIQLQERVLGHLLGPATVMHDQQHRAEHRRVVRAEHRLELLTRPRPHPTHLFPSPV